MALLLVVSAAAQNSPDGQEPPADEEMITLNFPANMDMKLLVDYVSKRLGVNILYDESKLRRKLTIAAPRQVPKSSLPGLLESVLRMNGLLLVEADQPGWKQIVEDRELADHSQIQADPSAMQNAAPTAVLAQIFRIQHAGVSQVQSSVQGMLSKPGGNLFAIPDQKMMIITDYADRLRKIAEIIRLLDQPQAEILTKFVPVRHRDPGGLVQEVMGLLQEQQRLEGNRQGPQVRLVAQDRTNQIVLIGPESTHLEALGLIEKLDVPSQAVTTTYKLRYAQPQRIDRLAREISGISASAKGEEYKSVIDAESGLLIVTALPRVHGKITQLITDLDTVEGDGNTPSGRVRFYKLMNTTADHVIATIQAMQSGEGGIQTLQLDGPNSQEDDTGPAKEPGRDSGPDLPGISRPDAPEGPARSTTALQTTKTADATLTSDPNTNTIIVVAPPHIQGIYEQLIKILDKRRPQVMIEVILVTLDTSNNFSLGVQIGGSDSFDDGRGRYVTFSSFGLSDPDAETGSFTLSPGIGFNGIVLSPDWANVVVRALAGSGRSEVLSAPRVLVNDNATASLASVSEAPYTSINASDTVATTSFAGYASAGTTINVTPHISEGNHLQLNYSVELNSFTGEGSATSPPPRQTNNISSEITIPNGHAVIVGGLTRKDNSNTESKVPFLGDIPILKHLVSSQARNKSQSTLFVFLRPVILRDDNFEDLKYLSQKDLQEAKLPGNYPDSTPMVMR